MANIGRIDKTTRIVAGIVLLGLSFLALGGFGTLWGIIAMIVGVVLLVTASINFCPAYKVLGTSTLKK